MRSNGENIGIFLLQKNCLSYYIENQKKESAMSQNLPVKTAPALTGELILPKQGPNPYLEGLEIITKFEKRAIARIPSGLTQKEFDQRKLAILGAFIANGFVDIIPGECDEIRPVIARFDLKP
jgi:hypothetical protein